MGEQPSLLDPKEQTDIDLHAALLAERKAYESLRRAQTKVDNAVHEHQRALHAWQEARA